MASIQAALTLAQRLAHPLSLTLALYWAAVVHYLRREIPQTQVRAEAVIALTTTRGFPQQLTWATPLRGWALAARGHGEEGRTQLQQGLAAYQATGAARDRPYHLALFAETCAQVGQTAAGLEALAEALATLAKSGVRWWEAELHRLRGELLLQHAGAQPGEAEACFQQAKSLELRTAMSLARLGLQQGKRAGAYELWPLSTAGAPRDSTPPTSRRPRHCSQNWGHNMGPYHAADMLRPKGDHRSGITMWCALAPVTAGGRALQARQSPY